VRYIPIAAYKVSGITDSNCLEIEYGPIVMAHIRRFRERYCKGIKTKDLHIVCNPWDCLDFYNWVALFTRNLYEDHLMALVSGTDCLAYTEELKEILTKRQSIYHVIRDSDYLAASGIMEEVYSRMLRIHSLEYLNVDNIEVRYLLDGGSFYDIDVQERAFARLASRSSQHKSAGVVLGERKMVLRRSKNAKQSSNHK
jgi:hypothetical protein